MIAFKDKVSDFIGSHLFYSSGNILGIHFYILEYILENTLKKPKKGNENMIL